MGVNSVPFEKKMHVLITGGAGFIGSHLAEWLIARHHDVTVLDDLSTGSLENLAGCRGDKLRFVKGSVADAELVHDLMAEADFVYHLASVVGVRLVLEQPITTLMTTITGSANVLEAAADYDVPCLLLSSSEVYGKGGEDRRPLAESGNLLLSSPSRIRWSYAAAKLTEECLAAAYHEERGVTVNVIRPFNVIGARQSHRYGMVVPRFVNWALRNEPLRVYGNGDQSRSFTSVTDAVQAITGLAEKIGAEFRIVNVGSENSISIRELAQLVIEVTGSRSSIAFGSEHEMGRGFEDVLDRKPDLTVLRSLLGSAPRIDMRAAIREVIEHVAHDCDQGIVAAERTPCRIDRPDSGRSGNSRPHGKTIAVDRPADGGVRVREEQFS